MPSEEFKQEVDRHLTGQETEPHEFLYFKVYKRQLLVIEEALETAGLMLGSNMSRGYCLEVICGGQLDNALRRLSREMSRRAPVETILFISDSSEFGKRLPKTGGVNWI